MKLEGRKMCSREAEVDASGVTSVVRGDVNCDLSKLEVGKSTFVGVVVFMRAKYTI
jgi:hypothetical protein